jgi:hypothetical protein
MGEENSPNLVTLPVTSNGLRRTEMFWQQKSLQVGKKQAEKASILHKRNIVSYFGPGWLDDFVKKSPIL